MLSKLETAVSSRSSDGAEMPPMHGRIHEAVFAREGDRTERNSQREIDVTRARERNRP